MFGGIANIMETFGGNDNFKRNLWEKCQLQENYVGEMTTSRKLCGGNDNIKKNVGELQTHCLWELTTSQYLFMGNDNLPNIFINSELWELHTSDL